MGLLWGGVLRFVPLGYGGSGTAGARSLPGRREAFGFLFA